MNKKLIMHKISFSLQVFSNQIKQKYFCEWFFNNDFMTEIRMPPLTEEFEYDEKSKHFVCFTSDHNSVMFK